MNKKPTFLIKTLGCKVNQCESREIRNKLIASGFTCLSGTGHADNYLINSCTVTHKADREVRRLIRKYHGINPRAKIAVLGCYAEMSHDRARLKNMGGVTHLVRNSEKRDIARILSYDSDADSRGMGAAPAAGGERDRYFLKIQDGCDNSCSYCKVSIVRGKSVSGDASGILEECGRLVSEHYGEIVLTGICLGSWRNDAPRAMGLPELLSAICAIKGDFRIRLSSIEPKYVSDQLIRTVAGHEKICNHLHIPLQSGDDKILDRMQRGYTTDGFLRMLRKAWDMIPALAFTTDVIVGFPGESDGSFRRTCAFMRKIRPSRTHIFTYSSRQGTRAHGFTDIPDPLTVKSRQKTMERMAMEYAFSFHKGLLGRKVPVLVESARQKGTGLLTGYTDSYVRILFSGYDECRGRVVPVKVENVAGSGVYGRMIGAKKFI